MADNDAPLGRIFNMTEAAAHLRVSRSSLYRLIRAGELKPTRIGLGRSVLTLADLDNYVRQQQQRGAQFPAESCVDSTG